MTAREFVDRLALDEARAGREQEPELEARYALALDRIARRAARTLRTLDRRGAVVAAIGDPPGWTRPDGDELFDAAAAYDELHAAGSAAYLRAMHTTAAGALATLGIRFDLRNPVMAGVLAQRGQKITRTTETLRREVMDALDGAWRDGASIPDAARRLEALGVDQWRSRAATIARTEIVGARNGASLAAARIANVVSQKVWMAAHDERTRDTHAEADGQARPPDQPFQVGDSLLMYPGDENGSAEETINCRCTIGYEVEDATTAAATMGASMTETQWAGPIAFEGVPTGDGRRIALGALGWRPLPLTLMAQVQPDGGGHNGAAVAGRIDSIEVLRNGDTADAFARGVFADSDFGREVAGLVEQRVLQGVSIDLDVQEYELVDTGEVELDPFFDEEFPVYELVVLRGEIMGATLCPFPAFAGARVDVLVDEAIAASAPLHLSMAFPFALTADCGCGGDCADVDDGSCVEDHAANFANYATTSGSPVVRDRIVDGNGVPVKVTEVARFGAADMDEWAKLERMARILNPAPEAPVHVPSLSELSFAVREGLLTPDDARALRGLDPLPDGAGRALVARPEPARLPDVHVHSAPIDVQVAAAEPAPAPQVDIHLPAQNAPDVHVTVPAPSVTVAPPAVTVTPQVRVEAPQRGSRDVVFDRDPAGRIVGAQIQES